MSRTGATRSVQRSLGWLPQERGERMHTQTAYCDRCGEEMRFDVADPQGLGRSMEQCSNRLCDNHTPHQVRPDPDAPPPRDPNPSKPRDRHVH